ncbi:MAG: hypothetical protein HC904_03685 [Blastochloris sp.]|nr:hypothetical protein [Blastochloris sp.]
MGRLTQTAGEGLVEDDVACFVGDGALDAIATGGATDDDGGGGWAGDIKQADHVQIVLEDFGGGWAIGTCQRGEGKIDPGVDCDVRKAGVLSLAWAEETGGGESDNEERAGNHRMEDRSF